MTTNDDHTASPEESTRSAQSAVDPTDLQEELSQIKDAMGIQERYPSAFQLWLLYGGLGVLAAFGSQIVVTLELSPWGHWVAWGGFYGVGYLYERFQLSTQQGTPPGSTPNIRVQIAGTVALLFAVLVAVSPSLGELSAVESQALIFALIIATVGAIYVVQGASLRAFNIRARDRYAFYAGGVWMLVFGAVMPRIDILQEWGYATFGILFAIHGIVSYVFLSQ